MVVASSEDDAVGPVASATVFLDTTLPDGKTVSSTAITSNAGVASFAIGSTGAYTSTVAEIWKPGSTCDASIGAESSVSVTVPWQFVTVTRL